MRFRRRQLLVDLLFCWLLLPAHVLFASGKYVLPPPTGPYTVGRTSYYLVDRARTDPWGSQPEHKREFMVEIWYPAEDHSASPPAPWLPEEWVPLEANGLLGMQLGRSQDPAAKDIAGVLRSVVTHAREKAPTAKSPQRFPILVFSPGNVMFPNEYSSVLEEMASQGYIVIANVPTGFATAVAFPDGHIARRNVKTDFALWVGDVTYMLDQAARWNADRENMFFGRMDLDRIGMFGHSAGANVTAMLIHADRRIKAGLALDPGLLRVADAGGPFLLLNAENADYIRRHPNDPDIAAMIQERKDFYRASNPGILVTLSGTDHNSFTDMAVIKAFDHPGDGNAFIATTRAFVREFFGEFPLGKRSNLIRRGSPKYPIATVEFSASSDPSDAPH